MDSDYSDNDSERSYESYYEFEDKFCDSNSEHSSLDSSDEGHHDGEPLADEEWLQNYENNEKKNAETEKMLNNRLENIVSVGEWCKCNKCSTSLLVNISECYCCHELDGCMESLQSDDVVQEVTNVADLKCVTQHPGFSPVCLQKWSLKLAADKYKTKDKQRYKQLGSEERFLRSVSYREFTRLIHGYLGHKKRIPLPACAYSCIRATFKTTNEENCNGGGFEMDLESIV